MKAIKFIDPTELSEGGKKLEFEGLEYLGRHPELADTTVISNVGAKRLQHM